MVTVTSAPALGLPVRRAKFAGSYRVATTVLTVAPGAWYALDPRIESNSVSECARQSLELALDDVVRIASGNHGDVQADVSVKGKGLHDVPGQRACIGNAGCHPTDALGTTDQHILLPGRLSGVDAVGAAGHVHHRLGQRLVQWHQCTPETPNAALVAERGTDPLAEHDRGVLDRVVGIDVQIAGALHLEVNERMLSESRQHVVEDAHPVEIWARAVP